MIREALEGGCYVLQMEDADWARGADHQSLETISPGMGSKALLQKVVRIEAEAHFSGHNDHPEAVIFFVEGHGCVKISGQRFDFSPNMACFVDGGEAIEILPDSGPAMVVMTSCLAGSQKSPGNVVIGESREFNANFPDRIRGIDSTLREAMGDRFFQIMVDRKMGCQTITCFIGEIPKSKAPSHFHLYEEALFILAGRGRMWTGEISAPIQAGDIIYLPRKQVHSLECTEDGGLRVCGLFYPAGSPAENY